MNYKNFNLGDWIGHISGVIEDESELDGNEMRDLVEFLSTLKQEPVLDKIRAEIANIYLTHTDGHNNNWYREPQAIINDALRIIDKYKNESEGK